MKFLAKVPSSRGTSEHHLDVLTETEIRGNWGATDLLLDGETVRADWAATAPGKYSLLLDGRSYEVRVWKSTAPGHLSRLYSVSVGARVFEVELQDPRSRRESFPAVRGGPLDLLAPMPGKIVRILAGEGAEVEPGQGLLVIEAMKMQNEVRAPRRGRVQKIHVSEGDGVEAGSPLMRLT